MSDIVRALVNGLLIGGVYALIALGLNLVFGVLKIKNFAHGEFVMAAMFVTFVLTTVTSLDAYILAPLVVAVMFVVGLILHHTLVTHVVGKPQENSILLTIGIMAILQGLALMIWGPDYRSVDSALANTVLSFGMLQIPATRFIAFVVAIVASAGVFLFLQQSTLGKQVRAAAENLIVAELLGVNTRRVYGLVFGLGIALAALGGVLLAPIFYVYPLIGQLFTLTAFVVVVLGGLGDLRGTVAAGLLVGIVESFAGTYVSFHAAEMAVFVLFVLALMIRPQGLFGRGITS